MLQIVISDHGLVCGAELVIANRIRGDPGQGVVLLASQLTGCDFCKEEMQMKRIIVKIGSSSLTHEKTGSINFLKMERLVRVLCDMRNRGYDVCLVSSGAIAVGKDAFSLKERPTETSVKQACAAVGQARLMMTYQKLFSEYNQVTAQVLMNKYTMTNPKSRFNAKNTFEELFRMGVIPVVNENDTVSTYEMRFGDNDTLSALVASLVGADMLVLLSDIDGLYTDDPHKNPDAEIIRDVYEIDEPSTSASVCVTRCRKRKPAGWSA